MPTSALEKCTGSLEIFEHFPEFGTGKLERGNREPGAEVQGMQESVNTRFAGGNLGVEKGALESRRIGAKA